MDHRNKKLPTMGKLPLGDMASKMLFLPLLLEKETHPRKSLPVSWGGCEVSGSIPLWEIWLPTQGWLKDGAPSDDMGRCSQTAWPPVQTAWPPVPALAYTCPQGGAQCPTSGAGAALAAPVLPCSWLEWWDRVGCKGTPSLRSVLTGGEKILIKK